MALISVSGASLKRALRDWRLREIKLLLLALVVAVLSVTSISFFTDRVERAMSLQGTALLGADMLVSSSRPIGEPVEQLALPYERVELVEFPSVIISGEDSLLTEVKVVGKGYPLRGSLESSTILGEVGSPTQGIPAPDEAWAAAEVFYQLGILPGDTIQLGNSKFKLTRVITFEMDAGGSIFRVAPRIMINLDALPQTGLITPASRATYKLLIAGEEAQMLRLRKPISAALGPSETLQTVEQGRPEITGALGRAVRFMKLASVLTIIIAGAAVALAVLSYTNRETRSIAVLKTMGATRKRLWQEYLLRFALLVIAATLLGSALGFAAQSVLSQLLSGWLNIDLPPPGLRPLGAGLITAMLTLAGFALPPIVRVIQTPPMRVMREESSAPRAGVWLSVASMSLAMAGFLVWQAGELKMASMVFAGVLGTLALMLGVARLITLIFRRVHVRHGRSWQLGLANIGRYGRRASLLITTIGIGIFALSLLGTVREDLISAWQSRVPVDAPNHFLINIQGAELDTIASFLKQRKLDDYQLYPMIRGRLRTINTRIVTVDSFADHQAKDSVRRELNLSTSKTLPNGNKIIAGQWFGKTTSSGSEPAEALISVETGIARQLGVGLNDTLKFDIAGKPFKARISSLREVQWDTMQPNFYVMASPGALDDYAATYITSVRIDPADTRFTAELVKAFPGVTVLDVRAILNQIQSIISQVSRAVEVVFAFSLLAGIVVLLAAIQTQRNDRRQEIAILKTLGASQQQIKLSVAAEFMVLGALAGITGAGLALLTGWGLANQVFSLSYQISWLPVIWGMLAGIIGLGGVGYAVIHQLIRTPPTHLLQEL